jgi:hypothetical protein
LNTKKLNIIGFVIFGLIVLALIGKNVFEKKSLEKESRYTIGEITNFEPKSRAGYRIDFKYEVQGKEYKAFGGIYENNKEIVGKKFFIKYSPNNPKNCQILLDKPVPDNIKNAPTEGWTEIKK